jgi:hypothetical protein
MPKRSPDQVVSVRLELQEKERRLLETATAVYGFEKSAEAINDLLSFKNLYIGVTVIEIITGREILLGTPNDLNDIVDAVKEWARSGGGLLYDPEADTFAWEDPESLGRRAASFGQYIAVYGGLASIAWLLRWPIPEDMIPPVPEDPEPSEDNGGGFDTIGPEDVPETPVSGGGPFGSPL